ncbi:c-type cytochrome [Stutzerimonas stutzeri]|uniref:C-type cytochrome n=1 Tax=Stutzerimonas stutzeri TaxID=316 RepID=A0A6I6LPA2_STUST|nr:c-type cytochrome [Stutzerimonas stutzeri]QGZ32494.1 c-type cytochrome [Stutzerimonas stutzeri]
MRLFTLLLLSCLAPFAHANKDTLEQFHYLMGDDSRRQQAYAAGQERMLFCGYCHGEDGNSKRPHIPNLAAQNPMYLFDSFEKFANGERIDFVMSKLAENLTLEDRVNIAVYFSQQKVKPATAAGDTLEIQRGAALYRRTCTGCHGNHAQGRETMPRLAGQPAEYISKALNRFRNHDPSRAGSVMMGIADKLSEAEIESLAAYLTQLQLTEQQEQQASMQLLGTQLP